MRCSALEPCGGSSAELARERHRRRRRRRCSTIRPSRDDQHVDSPRASIRAPVGSMPWNGRRRRTCRVARQRTARAVVLRRSSRRPRSAKSGNAREELARRRRARPRARSVSTWPRDVLAPARRPAARPRASRSRAAERRRSSARRDRPRRRWRVGSRGRHVGGHSCRAGWRRYAADARAARASASSAAASACCRASGACACRCRGPASRTATPGRSPPATASCWSTPGCTSRARSRTSSARWTRSTCALEHVRLLVCTHAHSDHYGQAAPIVERAGCELWMHPNHEHMTRAAQDPERGARAAPRGRAPERRARGAAARATPRRARGQRLRHRARSSSPTATCVAGRRGRDRPRHLAGRRDARPRALARLPATSPSAGC